VLKRTLVLAILVAVMAMYSTCLVLLFLGYPATGCCFSLAGMALCPLGFWLDVRYDIVAGRRKGSPC
jgi:uncharacterized membrane protein YccF (DUF307 family)